MSIVRTDYTAKTSGFSLLSLTASGVKVGDVMVVGVAVSGTSHSVFNVGDSASNTYYNATANTSLNYLPSPSTGTNPCSLVLLATKSIAAGNITVNVQLGATDLPSDLLLYVGVFTSNAGGIMQFDLGSFAGAQNNGTATNTVDYPYFSPATVNQMTVGIQAAGGTYTGLTSYSSAVVSNDTTNGITYLDVVVSQNVTSGYSAFSIGWTLATGIDSVFGLQTVYEFLPTTCTAAPVAAGYKTTGVAIGVGEVFYPISLANPGFGATDPIAVSLKSVPKGSAIIVVIGKYVGSGAFNTLSVTDGTNTYTNRLSYSDGTSPSVSVEVWSALGVAAGDYTITATFAHLGIAGADQEMHVQAIVVTPADPNASVAFDGVAPNNNNALSPTNTEGKSAITTTQNFDFIIGVDTAFPNFSPPTYPSVQSPWTTPTLEGSVLLGATTTQYFFIQLGSFFASGQPNPPGTYNLTQPWRPSGTNIWVSGAAAFGSSTDPVATLSASRLSGRKVQFG